MIEFSHVSKYYPLKNGVRSVLNDVSFRFPEHKNIGILGQNGAGKSTLLRLISGSELPDEGKIRRKGRFSWQLGFSGGFNQNLTGEENLRFIARIYDADLRKVTDFVHEFAELGNSLYEPIKSYSNGMRARLAFGLSLAIDFDVYLIDEVMAVGDPTFRRKSKAAFEERRQTASLILVSHDMKTIREYSDVIIILDKQKLTIYEDIEEGIAFYESLSGARAGDQMPGQAKPAPKPAPNPALKSVPASGQAAGQPAPKPAPKPAQNPAPQVSAPNQAAAGQPVPKPAQNPTPQVGAPDQAAGQPVPKPVPKPAPNPAPQVKVDRSFDDIRGIR